MIGLDPQKFKEAIGSDERREIENDPRRSVPQAPHNKRFRFAFCWTDLFSNESVLSASHVQLSTFGLGFGEFSFLYPNIKLRACCVMNGVRLIPGQSAPFTPELFSHMLCFHTVCLFLFAV